MSASVVASQTSAGSACPARRSASRTPAAPAGAHAARAGSYDRGAAAPGRLGGLVTAGVGHYDQVHRHPARGPGRTAQPGQACRQPVLLVMRRDDHANRPDHAIPVAWATDRRSPSARAYTSAVKSGSW